MVYTGFTAACPTGELTTEDCVRQLVYLNLKGKTEEEQVDILLPIFERMAIAEKELKSTGRLHILSEKSDIVAG